VTPAAPDPQAAQTGCPDPALPLARLARPASGPGLAGWLAARLPGRRLALCANARAGIRQACDRLGLGPGDEILVPAWNCGSEVDPLLDAGLSIRLFPTDRAGRADPGEIAARIGPKTRSVYLIHYFGWPQPETEAIAALCRERGLSLIEDCALALVSDDAGGAVGRHGDAAAFCLYKFFPLIGGGALALREDLEAPRFPCPFPRRMAAKALARELARRLLGPDGIGVLKRRFGRGGAAAPEAGPGLPDMPGHYYFDPAFRNAGPAAITRRLAARIDPAGEAEARRRSLALLTEALAGVEEVEFPLGPPPPGAGPLSAFVLLPAGRRDAVCEALQARGVAATPWWSGCHRGLDWSDPAAEAALEIKARGLSLPIHPGLSPGQVRWMAGELAGILRAPAG
jgi:dTDP-4-amino-4,6-dideoxygalactose transaminase